MFGRNDKGSLFVERFYRKSFLKESFSEKRSTRFAREHQIQGRRISNSVERSFSGTFHREAKETSFALDAKKTQGIVTFFQDWCLNFPHLPQSSQKEPQISSHFGQLVFTHHTEGSLFWNLLA